jgi:hypothetical protein
MIIDNTFSQQEFESTFLNENTHSMTKSQRKRRKRLHVLKLNNYEYEVSKSYFFIRLASADVLYQFNTEGYINKITMKVSWIQDILIYFLGFPLIFLGLEYYKDKSINLSIEFWLISLGFIAFFYGLQVWFYFYSSKDIKSDVEIELLANQNKVVK